MGPIELQIADIKLNPVVRLISFAVMFIITAVVYWVYRQLSNEPVILARKQAGLSYGKQKQVFTLGAILVIGLSFAVNKLAESKNAHLAKFSAGEICDEYYKYHVTHINNADDHIYAKLTAYNESESQLFEVEWQD